MNHPKTNERPLRSVDDLKARNKWAGQFFFSADTMRFFRTRVSDRVYSVPTGAYFVTSERDESPYNSRSYPRLYTVRFMDLDGNTKTIGEFQEHGSLRAAHKVARAAADAVSVTD